MDIYQLKYTKKFKSQINVKRFFNQNVTLLMLEYVQAIEINEVPHGQPAQHTIITSQRLQSHDRGCSSSSG